MQSSGAAFEAEVASPTSKNGKFVIHDTKQGVTSKPEINDYTHTQIYI